MGLPASARPPSRSSRSSTPVWRLLAETMRFFAEESCQKCTPCRIGNRASTISSRAAPRCRGAGGGVARGDGADVDLRPRPAASDPGPQRVAFWPDAGTMSSRPGRVHPRRPRASAPEGELLVHAAARHGVFIPTLCHDDKLDPYGGCRMCVVEVEGAPRPVPACADAGPRRHGRLDERRVARDAADAHGDAARRAPEREPRRAAERAHRPRGGARRRGAVRAPRRRARAVRGPQQADGLRPGRLHPLQPLRALHAGGDAVLGALVRGPRRARRASSPPRATPGSTPSASSAAAASRSARPARSTRSSRPARRPATSARSSKTKTTCTFCGVGCQIDLNVDPETKRIVKVTSEPSYVSNEGNLCVKGRFAFNFVHHPDRLTEPLVRGEDGELHPDRLGARAQVAAEGLKGVKERHGPQAVGVLASARLTNEENYLIQKLAADGGRHELRPLLRSHLTRSDSLRPGQVVRQRSKHQLDPGDRERPLPARDRLEHDGGAPGARAADQEGGAQRRDARRRRPAQDLADEDREAPPAAAARARTSGC